MYLNCKQHNKSIVISNYLFSEKSVQFLPFDEWLYSFILYVEELSDFVKIHKHCEFYLCNDKGEQTYPINEQAPSHFDKTDEIRTGKKI